MTSPEFGKLAKQVSDREKAELFTAVMDSLEASTQNGVISSSILFHPFGNYFFVSEEGALCVDSPVTVIKMMHLLLSTSSPSRSIEDHLKYGEYVNRLSLEMLNQKNSLLRNIPNSSYEAGLELAIQSSGLADKVINTLSGPFYKRQFTFLDSLNKHLQDKCLCYTRVIKLFI
jgi:hypothetical protein